jgi:hypothetical protein
MFISKLYLEDLGVCCVFLGITVNYDIYMGVFALIFRDNLIQNI